MKTDAGDRRGSASTRPDALAVRRHGRTGRDAAVRGGRGAREREGAGERDSRGEAVSGARTGGILRSVAGTEARVEVPAHVSGDFEVFLNGVPQVEGRDYRARRAATLVFDRPLAKEGRLGTMRWLSMLARRRRHLPAERLGRRRLRVRRQAPRGDGSADRARVAIAVQAHDLRGYRHVRMDPAAPDVRERHRRRWRSSWH